MSPSSHVENAVARFLGADAARGGPHALLGLPTTGFADLDVIEARERGMQRVDQHAECFTPAADEVRLALHAATAQLLNPAVRERLHQGSLQDRRRAAMLGLEHDAVLTLAMYGGWTRRSLPRLVALAHARGLTASDVADAVRSISKRRHAAPPGRTEGPGIPGVAPIHSVRTAWVVAGVALVSTIVSGAIIWAALGRESPRVVATGGRLAVDRRSGDALVLPPPRDIEQQTGATPAPGGPEIAPDDLVEAFDRALALAPADPSAAEALGVAGVRSLSRHWLRLPAPVRARTQDAVIELMYRLGGASMNSRPLLEALGEGAALLRPGGSELDGDGVARAAWSIGMLTRLRHESDLSARSQALIDRWLGSALLGARPAQLSFADGALAAAQVMAEPLSSQTRHLPEAWRAWSRAVVLLTESDVTRRSMLLARGAELVMTNPSSPERRADSFEAIAAVVAAMPWSLSPETRAWLVRQFDNREVSTASLSAATQSLVARSDAQGVDPTMVLSGSASELDRRALRDRYITAWGLSEPGSDVEVLDRLGRASGELSPGLADNAAPERMLRTAVAYARLNAAAAARWQGDGSGSLGLLDRYAVPDTLTGVRSGADIETASDGNWAERYLLQGSNIEGRLELLSELRAGSRRSLGPIDAEVLVTEALRGSGRGVRESARDLVEVFGSSPAIVNSLLEEAPRIPPIQTMSDLIVGITVSPLPDRNSPRWRIGVRRALVERLLELLAAEGETADIDLLASLFDDAYAERALLSRAVPTSGDATTPPAERSAGLLRARWMRLADRSVPSSTFSLTMDEIERRRAGRAALARGLIQRFVVEQIALAETMAYVVASERPGLGAAVGTVLTRLEADLQRSTHVFQQVGLVERAMLDLWQIRLGLDLTRGNG